MGFFVVFVKFIIIVFRKTFVNTSVQSRTSIAQETKDVFFPSESLEQQLSYAVQMCDQLCRNAWLGRQVVAPASVVCKRW